VRVLFLTLVCGLGGILEAQTGTAVPSLAPFDDLVTGLLAKYRIPGASLALTQNGRLIYARGYGDSDAHLSEWVQPDALFRIASLSKAITAVAVMKLVEQGKIKLDTPAFALLPDLHAPGGWSIDPRLNKITVRNLLNHTGGWDRDKAGGYDPMFISPQIVSMLGVPAPASTENIIRYMRGKPVDNVPGTKYAYSNFGYAVLGRIIERVTGQSYEQWVRANVLAPAGISDIRIGQTLPRGRFPGEVQYIGPKNAASVFADVPGPVDWAYGGWYLEAMDSHGGWVASAIDYAKFLNAIDGRRGAPLLTRTSIATLTATPAIDEYRGASSWYAMGMMVNTANNWWHSGSLDGTATYFIRTGDGSAFVLFLNSRDQGEAALFQDIDSGYWNARSKVSSWPTNDLFTNYPDIDPQVFAATPSINGREGALNSATFDRGVVSGSWFSIFGANLSATRRMWTAADIVRGALPTSLDGVSVTVDGNPAFVYYISPEQINVQAPAGLNPGWSRVEVTRNGIVSSRVLTHADSNAPGAFTYVLGGHTFAIATNLAGTVLGDPTLSPELATCAPGDTIVIYTTGLTASPAGTATVSQPPLNTVQVAIGGFPAKALFAGLVTPGLFQINATVPSVPNGGYSELVITSDGFSSPPGVVVFVQK
jgi:N-acyl-D-amino-acid deacylase